MRQKVCCLHSSNLHRVCQRVDKTFYFTLLEGNLLDRWLQGWVGRWRSVEAGLLQSATACDLIQDVDCLGQEQIRKNLWRRFLSDSKQFVVVWCEVRASNQSS